MFILLLVCVANTLNPSSKLPGGWVYIAVNPASLWLAEREKTLHGGPQKTHRRCKLFSPGRNDPSDRDRPMIIESNCCI